MEVSVCPRAPETAGCGRLTLRRCRDAGTVTRALGGTYSRRASWPKGWTSPENLDVLVRSAPECRRCRPLRQEASGDRMRPGATVGSNSLQGSDTENCSNPILNEGWGSKG